MECRIENMGDVRQVGELAFGGCGIKQVDGNVPIARSIRLRSSRQPNHLPIVFGDEPFDDVSTNDTEGTNNDRLFLHPVVSFRQTEPALSSVRRGHLERRLVPRKTAGKSLVQGSRPASSGVIILTSACSIIQHFCIEPIAEEISWSAAGPIHLPPQKEGCHARRQILPTASKRVSLTRAVDHRSAIESAL